LGEAGRLAQPGLAAPSRFLIRAVPPVKITASVRYRSAVLVRALAAVFGGYGFAAALAYAVARALPHALSMTRSEATTTATLLGVLAMPGSVIWVFAVSSARRAVMGIVIATMLVLAIGWLLGAPA
jgi:hypothetical protein